MKSYIPPRPEIRMIRLELQHAITAIERARLIAAEQAIELEADLVWVIENLKGTVLAIDKGEPARGDF